ncbi:hypothetical protein L1987_54609 [Smallanthus sonchifolius]|uniref:Uncharacterized protein n=1 Tax=Smallanthus sonchifolius TaxID=185202 RepID=A0ACB9E8A6_9ASTR|nr:hypothetical protein L1987_54609 [Smallanthus sonchifolius]
MFSYKKNETLSEQVTRFTTMLNRLRKMGVKFDEYDLGKKLLDSLPDCWSIPCMLIKNTTPDLKNKTLDDTICLLESYELDVKKRELNNQDKQNNSGSTNAALFSGSSEGSSGTKSEKRKGCCEHSSGEKVKSSGQILEDQIALFGAFMSSYDALVIGNLQPAMHDVEDLVQINPDDLEYMNLQWQMAMIVVRAKNYLQKVGKDKLQFGKKVGFDKAKSSATTVNNMVTLLDAEDELDEALMAEIEVSKKPAEIASDCALKTMLKKKGKVVDSGETSSESEVNSDSESDICSSLCVERMQNYHVANTFLLAENDKLKRIFSEKLVTSETELINERVIVAKWKMQQSVFDECVSKQRTGYIKGGLGYNKVPHPDNFVPFPEPHESNELMNACNSNFHDMYISADINSGCVDDDSEIDGVKSFSSFNKQCTREFIRECIKYLDVDCNLNRFVSVSSVNVDVNNIHVSDSDSDASYVSAYSTNVCEDSDCVSEVSSTSTFFDKVVYTARDYVPLHKVSSLAGDVVLDEFGNPLIQEYDLSSDRPKKNDVIAPENHILTSETENNKVVKVKVSVPTTVQRKSWCVKGKSIDVKDWFIDVKDKPVQSK